LFRGETVQPDEFVAGRMAANQLDAVLSAMQPFCEQFDKRFVRRSVDRRSGNLDPKFSAERFANLVLRSSWLNLDG
jgi:hypothetical protein